MHKTFSLLALTLLCAFSNSDMAKLSAVETQLQTVNSSSFHPFTGKISKNKVRMRLQPSYEGYVLKELEAGELLPIVGETEDFYVVPPPSDFKGYIFRTYVLDDVVEGSRVNVRLKPDVESPILAQLNQGDRIEGAVFSSLHPKWLEIKVPSSTHFYVAKEYIENIGDIRLIDRLKKRKQEALQLLEMAQINATTELNKPFESININRARAHYQTFSSDYSDFPELVQVAKNSLAKLEEAYIAKKIAFLEHQNQQATSELIQQNQQLSQELNQAKTKAAQLEKEISKTKENTNSYSLPNTPNPLPFNMAHWIPIEEKLFLKWSKETGKNQIADFYDAESKKAFILKGVIEVYNRSFKNKPGDYMLMTPTSNLPVAFLYSTKVNLQDLVGQEVSLLVAERPNNHYAFPAYFVLKITKEK